MKQRTRFFIFMVTVLVASLVSSAHGSLSSSSIVIARGSFHGVSWRRTGYDSSDGTYCLTMKIPASSSGGAGSCGSITGGRGCYEPHGISLMTHQGAPLPGYVGAVLRTRTIAPRSGLVAGIRFYAVELPCPAWPTQLRARAASGRIVGYLDIPPHTGFRGKITC